MMRFKEGSRVEVLRKSKGTYGSWFPAKIVSKSGNVYTIKYELYLNGKGEVIVEKVNEEDIRPCPPPSLRGESWFLGDVVEVFDLLSWRVGRIVDVLNNDCVAVKLFGSAKPKKFHVSDLRAPQAWRNNRWIKLGKVSEEGKSYNVPKYEQEYVCSPPPIRTANKKPNISKRNWTSEVGEYRPLAKRALPKKVDAFPLSDDLVGKHSTHPPSEALPFTDENVECSVASCSGKNSPEYGFQNTRKNCRVDSGSFFDDTPSSAPKEELTANIHELELHAYCSTVRAMYASGPLSWEKESILTSLRMFLHISNEEHLLQLRNLLSA